MYHAGIYRLYARVLDHVVRWLRNSANSVLPLNLWVQAILRFKTFLKFCEISKDTPTLTPRFEKKAWGCEKNTGKIRETRVARSRHCMHNLRCDRHMHIWCVPSNCVKRLFWAHQLTRSPVLAYAKSVSLVGLAPSKRLKAVDIRCANKLQILIPREMENTNMSLFDCVGLKLRNRLFPCPPLLR